MLETTDGSNRQRGVAQGDIEAKLVSMKSSGPSPPAAQTVLRFLYALHQMRDLKEGFKGGQ